MKKILSIIFLIPVFANSQTIVADTIYYSDGAGGYTKVVTYRNYNTTSFWPKADTVNAGTVMTKWNAANSIAGLQATIDTKITASSINTLTNKSGLISQWTNDQNYLTAASLTNAAANNSTKGIATFDSLYFNDNGSGLITWGLNTGTGSISGGAVTINFPRGKITYSSPSILAAGTASITLNNSLITATSVINVGINGNGSNLISVNCYIKSQTAGSCVINIQNLSLLNLFNSAMVIDFLVVN